MLAWRLCLRDPGLAQYSVAFNQCRPTGLAHLRSNLVGHSVQVEIAQVQGLAVQEDLAGTCMIGPAFYSAWPA